MLGLAGVSVQVEWVEDANSNPGGYTMKKPLFSLMFLALAANQGFAAPGESWYVVTPAYGGAAFDVNVYVDASASTVGAYQLTLAYDAGQGIRVDTTKGQFTGVSAGADGFVAAANAATPGQVVVNGFDTQGRVGTAEMHLVTVHFAGRDSAAVGLKLNLNKLVTEQGVAIGQ